MDNALPKSGGIPLVSKATWSSVIEKSHVSGHLFDSARKWAGEITKIAMVTRNVLYCVYLSFEFYNRILSWTKGLTQN